MSGPRQPAWDFDYERGGGGYAVHRRADPRIERMVWDALGSARTVVNVGAGAGSYEPKDRDVVAIEPSARMRSQRPDALAPAIDAIAERLPLEDRSVDAAMAIITVHHWRDPGRGLRELRRVSRGPVVVMTFDGDVLDRLWLAEYAPEMTAAESRRLPAIDWIRETLGGRCEVLTVPIAPDCTDGFTEAYYARPERFLDPAVRRAQSCWSLVGEAERERSVEALRADLESGAWDERFGQWRSRPFFEGALRLIVAEV